MTRIVAADLNDDRVAALLRHHLAEARASTPADNAHALDLSGLAAADVTLLAMWEGDTLLGVGALRALPGGGGEIKSMRTHPDHLRCGVARALLDALVALARARSYRNVSLETGTAPMFAPANALYERYGFVDGPMFGGYPASSHNRFMHLPL